MGALKPTNFLAKYVKPISFCLVIDNVGWDRGLTACLGVCRRHNRMKVQSTSEYLNYDYEL